MEAGRSYHSVDVLKLNNWHLLALGTRHGDSFEAVATFVLSCECKGGKQSGLMQQPNRGIDWLLEDKRGGARHCSHSLASILLTGPGAELPGQIHALFLTRCRQEARNRESGNASPGPSSQYLPLLGLAGDGGCEAALIRIIRRLPALGSHRQKATEIVLLPVITGDSLPIRLNLPSGMGYAGRPLVHWAHRQLTDMRPP